MPHNLRFWKQLMQLIQQFDNTFSLLRCTSVARLAFLIQTSLIADADRASIIRSGMRTHFQQLAVLRHRTIFSDVEVIADIIKPTCLMVTSQLFHTIVLIASGSRAMQHQKSHRVGRIMYLPSSTPARSVRSERTFSSPMFIGNVSLIIIGSLNYKLLESFIIMDQFKGLNITA